MTPQNSADQVLSLTWTILMAGLHHFRFQKQLVSNKHKINNCTLWTYSILFMINRWCLIDNLVAWSHAIPELLIKWDLMILQCTKEAVLKHYMHQAVQSRESLNNMMINNNKSAMEVCLYLNDIRFTGTSHHKTFPKILSPSIYACSSDLNTLFWTRWPELTMIRQP